MSRTSSAGRRAACAALLTLAATPARAAPPMPLACTFKAVQVSQLRGAEFAAGPTGGTISLTLAASPVDVRLGRVAVIGDDRAEVAEMRSGPRDTTILGLDPSSATVLSLFTAAATEAVIPAVISRHELIGMIPVVTQAVGSCKPV